MNHPTSPMVCSEAGIGLLADILGAFTADLNAVALSAEHTRRLLRSAWHFLIWLDLCDVAVESVDDAVLYAFRRHDCQCPGMEGERQKMLVPDGRAFPTGALKLVQFLEDNGWVPHLGELDANLRHLDAFLVQCREQGYRPGGVGKYRNSCRHFLSWLHRSRISIADVDTETLERFRQHDCVCPGTRHTTRHRGAGARQVSQIRSFVQYLTATDVVSVQKVMPEPDARPAMGPFEEWLRRHRGIGGGSIARHSRQAAMLVAGLGSDPRSYDAAAIRDALLGRYDGVSSSFAGKLACSMRMYLRYLASSDICSPSLIDAVPTATTWRLAPLPRYILPEQVEHVIACCDVTTPTGCRDKAILLLLARLALRAGDIVALRLEDIDWRGARVRVCGKSKREECLPLPQDAGDGILDYIEKARPRVAEKRIFLRAIAPYRPLASSHAITGVVVRALKRAGLEEVRPQGAHLFRHSAATNLLRSGQSLETISTLLRHKSMATTTIYAKTDAPMLLEIAQPWIGDPS